MQVSIKTFREDLIFVFDIIINEKLNYPVMPSILIFKDKEELSNLLHEIDNDYFIWQIIGKKEHELQEYEEDLVNLVNLTYKMELDPYSLPKKAVDSFDDQFLDKFFKSNVVSDHIKAYIYEYIEQRRDSFEQLEERYA